MERVVVEKEVGINSVITVTCDCINRFGMIVSMIINRGDRDMLASYKYVPAGRACDRADGVLNAVRALLDTLTGWDADFFFSNFSASDFDSAKWNEVPANAGSK